MATLAHADPASAVDVLAASARPWLFGVRHHSPACSAALPALLDALAPTAVAVELPADLAAWLPWLAHAATIAPVAIAAVSRSGDELGFYPFADFSPELVAIRWAAARGVPVHAIDLPSGRRGGIERGPRGSRERGIAARLAGDDGWERLVEAPAVLAEPERVRRAALLYGWALRLDTGGDVDAFDRARETVMRAALAPLVAAPGARVAAIVGSFHAAALVDGDDSLRGAANDPGASVDMVSSLIPYTFELLDARSGYAAGIRDPMWQQRLWQELAARDGGDVTGLVARCLVEITRAIRARGLPASVPDARAAAELAMSLATLRRLAAPGRRELIEAVQSALAQGELLGRGRVVARALGEVLVGGRRGHLAPGTPRSGLGPHVAALLVELRLPHEPMTEPEDVRLDPLRSRSERSGSAGPRGGAEGRRGASIDRRRHVAMCRLRACGVPYAQQLDSVGVGGVDALTASWRIRMTPATEAMIELAGLRGVTLHQAAAGALRAEHAHLDGDDKITPAALIALTEAAAEAGCGDLVEAWLAALAGPRLADASLGELIALVALVERIAAGHVVGLPASLDDAIPGEIDVYDAPPVERAAIVGAAVASVLGLAGSESLADARALGELARLFQRAEHAALGDGRLRWSLDELARTGTPLIAGAAAVVQVLIGSRDHDDLATQIGGWLDAAVDREGRSRLAHRLRGALGVAGPRFEAEPAFLDGLAARVESLDDDAYLARSSALREGFEVLSTASRRRLLRALGDRLGVTDARGLGLDVVTEIPPAMLALAADADAAGRAAMEELA
jgi:hypothetical protein